MSKPPRPKQNWMQPLHIPIKIGRRKLRLLDDLRRHLLNLSDRQHGLHVWQHAIRCAMEAAEGGDISRAETAFRLAMMQDEGSSGPP